MGSMEPPPHSLVTPRRALTYHPQPSCFPMTPSPTLLTGMKPRESRLMPLCLRKPVAGTAPDRTGPLCPLPAPPFSLLTVLRDPHPSLATTQPQMDHPTGCLHCNLCASWPLCTAPLRTPHFPSGLKDSFL